MKKTVLLINLLLIITLFNCCENKSVNSNNHSSFTSNGILNDYPVFLTSKPEDIKVYIEASGSMNGFFRRNVPNAFKRDTWSILSYTELNIDTVYLFTGSTHPLPLVKSVLRERMNQGTLTSTSSTDILSMIRKMMNALEEGESDCVILLSDMKYSPTGNLQMALSQYETDIRNLVQGKPYGYSLIGAQSEFVNSQGKVQSEESPYYYFVMGKSEKVVWIRKEIVRLLGNNFVGVVELGMDYKTPLHSALANKGVSNCMAMPKICTKDRFYLFNSYTNEGSFIVAADYSHLIFAVEESDISITTAYGSSVNCKQINLDWSTLSEADRKRSSPSSTFFQITLPKVRRESEIIELQIEPKEKKTGIERFYGATTESDYDKSFSIENLLLGLRNGCLMHPIQQEPLRILISKQK